MKKAGENHMSKREALLAHADAAYAFALSLAGSAEAAEELCQEAFLRALEARDPVRSGGSGRARFMRFVFLTALSRHRGEKRRRARERRAAMERELRMDGPGETAAARESAERVRVAVAGLREELRAPVHLHYLQGMTCAEAGAVLGLSPKAVERRVERALSELRRTLSRAGLALVPAAILGALGGAPVIKAPTALVTKLGSLTGGAKAGGAGIGTAAAGAAAKGGLAMKVVAGIVAASTLAGAVAVSTGAFQGNGNAPLAALGDGKPAPVNPYNGMQEREEVFEFTTKPKVTKQGDKWIITFASKGKCDATVSILDKDGKIVRHLASGVLGSNAPWPFQQNSLNQKVEWDGLTDDFKKADTNGCKVRVSLGLKAEFDKSIAYDPYLLPGESSTSSHLTKHKGQMLVGRDGDGKFYVGTASKGNFTGQVFGKDGKYIRTFFPPPAAEVEKVMGGLGLKFGTTKWGDKVIMCRWKGPFADLPGNLRTPPNKAKSFKDLIEAYPTLAKLIKAQPGVGEVKMMPRPKEIQAASVPGGGAVTGHKLLHVSADRARDEVYAQFGGQVRFSGKTGELDKTWFPGKDNLSRGSGTTECSIGPDGFIYLRFDDKGRYMFRVDHAGKLVPFAKENVTNVSPGKAWWVNVPGPFKTTGLDAVHVGHKNGSMTHQNGLHVAPSGLIAVGIQYLDTDWGRKNGVKWAPKQFSAVTVFDNDGKLLSGNAVGETHAGQGVTMDRDGNIYAVISGALPPGQKTFEGSDVPVNTNGGCTSLIKFRGRGGKYPLNVGSGVKVQIRRKASEMPGALWVYGGVSSRMSGCYCHQTRFDMDPWARTWLPSNQFYSVTVIDSNMNRIARIGRYGNVDDADEKYGRIHFAWLRAVAVSDVALYAADHGNRRILRAALSYHAEETVGLDGSVSVSTPTPTASAPAASAAPAPKAKATSPTPAAPTTTPPASAPASATRSAEQVCRGWWSLAMSYKRAGRKDKAREYLQRIVKEHPTNEYAARAKKEMTGL